jgi:hypothetical protein
MRYVRGDRAGKAASTVRFVRFGPGIFSFQQGLAQYDAAPDRIPTASENPELDLCH